MPANLSVTDIALLLTPPALVGTSYWLFVRLRTRGLSRAVHYAFRVTLGILAAWGVWSLWVVGSGDGWSRLVLLPWVFFSLPVAAATWLLTWAIAVIGWPEAYPRGLRRNAAVATIALMAAAAAAYGFREAALLGPARNVRTDAATLRALMDSIWAAYDTALLEAIAFNKATPADVLERLARHPRYTVRMKVCNNSAAPAAVLRILAQDHALYTRYCVAGHRNAPPPLLTEMAKDPDPSLRHNVAANTNTPVQALATLAGDPAHLVRQQIAANRVTPIDVLTPLASDANEIVRMLVARHPRATRALRLKLANDPSAKVKQALVGVAGDDMELLTILSKDDDERVRRSARDQIEYQRRRK